MNLIKEKPILFNSEMVRAVLEGRKTQTRRVVKLDHGEHLVKLESGQINGVQSHSGKVKDLKCPYGKPSDRLWVREKFTTLSHNSSDEEGDAWIYAASENGEAWESEAEGWRWKPSIFMPRAASRILLEVIDVRVEKLKKMNRGDAMSEGCPFPNIASEKSPLLWFRELWDSINKARGCDWDSNPYVWVVEFKVLEVKGALS